MNIFRRFTYWIKDKRFEKRMAKQRKKKGYANCDCWGMHYWLGNTFPKMIRTLRDMKHGSPDLQFEEFENFPLLWVAEESKVLLKQKKKDDYEEEIDLWGKDKCFDRWWFVLSRIAFCLEQTNDEITEIENEYQEEYFNQVFGKPEEKESFKQYWDRIWEVNSVDKKGKPLTYVLKEREVDEDLKQKYKKREDEIAQYREDMKNEAFDLLKKYFWNLWD